MGSHIAGQIALSLRVDGVEVPLGNSRQAKVIINQSCRQLVPAMKCELPDFANVFGQQVPINDGSAIEIELNDDRQAAFNGSTVFNTFGTPHRQPAGQYMQYTVVGLLDAPLYLRGNPEKSITGSSADVMRAVAQRMDFKYNEKIVTNDHMMWRPGRETWGTFTGKTAQHGWIGEQSALLHAVDEQRNLRYVDVNDLFANAAIKAHLIYGGSSNISPNIPRYLCTQYKAVNRSGMLNHWLGFGYRMTQSNITGGTTDSYSKIKGMTVNNSLDISKSTLKELNGRARIDLPPLNTGNTHDNFLRARHQNMRGLATYSQNVYVLIPMTTGLNLLDLIEFEAGAANYTDESVSGIYAVTNMTRMMANSRYYEKIELTAAGPQTTNPDLAGVNAPGQKTAVGDFARSVGSVFESSLG